MHQLEEEVIQKVLAKALSRGGEFAEAFYEQTHSTSISFNEQKVKGVSGGISEGIGIRVIAGERTGYAYSDDLTPTALLEAAAVAAHVAAGPLRVSSTTFRERTRTANTTLGMPVANIDSSKKVELLHRADEAARSQDGRIREVSCTYGEIVRHICIMNSEGLWSESADDLFRMSIAVVVVDGGRRESGMEFLGGRFGFDYFDSHTPEEAAKGAVLQAVTKLKAIPAPAGQFPVVINAGWGGVLVHEGVGHGLEGDFNRKGTSIYSGMRGQQVASSLVTIIDDGTVPNGRGSLSIDDEGTPMQKTLLIEDGILGGFLYDKINANLDGVDSTGNGRRESYRHIPYPRMSNTYISGGVDAPEDLIRSVQKGIFAKTLGGGQVDIVSGNFVFEISEGYLIEEGRVSTPVRGANLIGNGPEAMRKVIGVGKDLAIEKRVGSCGKEGQYVPVGVGQPTILISDMTIGGTDWPG